MSANRTCCPRCIFLHGFASSPGGIKAQRFREAFAARGIDLLLPDLNLSNDGRFDFRGLTLTRQLDQIERLAGDRETILIGSSFGGYAAALFAAANPGRVKALVLMAPAFDFAARWKRKLGAPALEQWRDDGIVEVDHYATATKQPLAYELMRDAERHPPYPQASVPTLIFHGRHDESVAFGLSTRFVAESTSAELVAYEADHALHDVVDDMLARCLRFVQPWVGQVEVG